MKYPRVLFLFSGLFISCSIASYSSGADSPTEKPTILGTIDLINSGHRENVADLFHITPETEKDVKALFKLYENDKTLYEFNIGGLGVILRRISDPRLYPILGKFTKSGKPGTRYEAIKTLAKIGDATAIEYLEKSLSEESEDMARAAAAGLVRIEKYKAISVLIKKLVEPNGDLIVARPLASLGLPALQALLKEIQSRGKFNQSIAVISTINDPNTRSSLEKLAKEWDGKFQQAAISGLINIGAGKSALPILTQELKGNNILTHIPLIPLLGKINDSSVLPLLKGILETNTNKEVLTATIRAIGEQHQQAGIHVLMEFHKTRRPDIDLSVFIDAIAAIGGPSAVNTLTLLYQDAQKSRFFVDAIAHIATGLGDIGEPSGTQLLKQIACASPDKSGYATSLAIKSLARIPGVEAEDTLSEILQSCNPGNSRVYLLQRLAKHNSKLSTDTLMGIINGKNGYSDTLAISALGKTGEKRAIPILRQILVTSNGNAQKAHVYPALAELGENVPTSEFVESFNALNCCTGPITDSLETFGAQGNRTFLRQIIDDKSAKPHLRLAAAKGLIQFGDKTGLFLARNELKSHSISGTILAIEILKALGDKSDIPTINEYLEQYRSDILFLKFDFEEAPMKSMIRLCEDAISTIQARGH